MKIIAVVVTYNRLPLLQKCLQAVLKQTREPDQVIVVNNGSTDNTLQWLETQPVTTYSQQNLGGAGGFASGINLAYGSGADWIWLMDDDTIPEPDALQQLVSLLDRLGENQDNIGFLSSKVLWTDGSIHEMNRTYQLQEQQKLALLSIGGQQELSVVQFGTFVSMLLSRKAVKKVGLPFEEYFIWNDDVEYSKRIIRSGLAGLAAENSITRHETPTNHQSNVFIDPETSIWKFRYGLRNELFTKRFHDGELQFWITWIHRMFIMPFRILLKRKQHRWKFIKVVWETSISAITFRPRLVKAHPASVISLLETANKSDV